MAAVTSPARFGAAYEEEQFGRQGGGILASMASSVRACTSTSRSSGTSRRGEARGEPQNQGWGATVTIAGRQIVPQGLGELVRRRRVERHRQRRGHWSGQWGRHWTGPRALIVLSDRCTVTMTASHDDPSSIVPTGERASCCSYALRTTRRTEAAPRPLPSFPERRARPITFFVRLRPFRRPRCHYHRRQMPLRGKDCRGTLRG